MRLRALPSPLRNAAVNGLALAVGAGVLSLACPARAQQSSVAEAFYRDGQRLIGEGKIHEACLKFGESQRADPALGTLIALAACHEKEGRIASAWSEFNDAAEKARDARDKARAHYAKGRADSLAKKLFRVTLEAKEAPQGLAVQLDGASFGTGALGTAIPLDPGEHVVAATAPGKPHFEKKFSVPAEAGSLTVEITFDEEKAATSTPDAATPASAPTSTPASPADSQPSHESKGGGSSNAVIGGIVAGAGVALLAGGIFFEVRAHGQQSDAEDGAARASSTQDPVYQQAASDHDAAKTSQLIGFGLGGVGLVAIGVGGYFLLAPRHEEPARTSLHLVPAVGKSSSGVEVVGTW